MLLMLLIGLATFYGSRRAEQRLATMKLIIADYCGYVLSLDRLRGHRCDAGGAHSAMAVRSALDPICSRSHGMAVQVSQRSGPTRRIYNPQDPAIFVQKRLGLGYTVNFGNRISWVLLALVLTALGGMVFFLPRSA
jgi:hypothetical protein